jgi:hypothetical protein
MSTPYIAIVDDEEIFDLQTHTRRDLFPTDLTMTQNEGELCSVDMTVVNPQTQLSSFDGRRVILSTKGAVLFDGVIQGVPYGLIGNQMTIQAFGTTPDPETLETQVALLKESLKVAPYYDPLFVPDGEDDNAIEILTGRSSVICHSRIKGAPVLCDALSGSTTLEIVPIHQSLSISAEKSVAQNYGVTVSAKWKQNVRQTLGDNNAFFQFSTLTKDAIIENFPKLGSTIGSDFRVTRSVAKAVTNGFAVSGNETFTLKKQATTATLDPAWEEAKVEEIEFKKTRLDLDIAVEYRFDLERTETLSVLAETDMQAGVVVQTDEIEELNLRSLSTPETADEWASGTDYLIGDLVTYGNYVYTARVDHTSGDEFSPADWTQSGETSYLSSQSLSSFFKSARGQQAIEHIEQRIRSRARIASRCVYIDFEAKMPQNPHDVTHDCMVSITAPQLPGGVAVGRLINYTLSWTDGRWSLSGQIACAAGSGGADDFALGTATVSTYTPSGRMSVKVENTGDEQQEILEGAQQFDAEGVPSISDVEVPETKITFTTTPTSVKSLEQEAEVPISGSIGLPNQVNL